jgi:hypothetical protein
MGFRLCRLRSRWLGDTVDFRWVIRRRVSTIIDWHDKQQKTGETLTWLDLFDMTKQWGDLDMSNRLLAWLDFGRSLNLTFLRTALRVCGVVEQPRGWFQTENCWNLCSQRTRMLIYEFLEVQSSSNHQIETQIALTALLTSNPSISIQFLTSKIVKSSSNLKSTWIYDFDSKFKPVNLKYSSISSHYLPNPKNLIITSKFDTTLPHISTYIHPPSYPN